MSADQFFYLLIFIIYAIVGSLIINNAYKAKKSNVYYFGINILINALIYLLVFFSLTIAQYFLREIGLLSALVFTKLTFYQEKKGPFLLFFIIALVSGVVEPILSIIGTFIITNFAQAFPILFFADILFVMNVLIIASWYSYASFETYKEIKSYDLEPFQKKRYLTFGTSGIFIMLAGIAFLFLVPTQQMLFIGLIVQMLVAGFTLTFIIMNFLVWVAPKFFINRLNKGYVSSSNIQEELSEDELMKKLRGDA